MNTMNAAHLRHGSNIGQKLTRREGMLKVTGAAHYAADHHPPGMLYAVLAVLSWFTLGEGKILVGNRAVELKVIPLLVLGGFALRTVIARQAEKIRREGSKG